MKIITGNLLSDGSVVYLDTDGQWNTRIDHAKPFDGADAETALETAQARVSEIAGAYLIDIQESGRPGGRETFKEEIRATGPTVKSDWRAPETSRRSVSDANSEGSINVSL